MPRARRWRGSWVGGAVAGGAHGKAGAGPWCCVFAKLSFIETAVLRCCIAADWFRSAVTPIEPRIRFCPLWQSCTPARIVLLGYTRRFVFCGCHADMLGRDHTRHTQGTWHRDTRSPQPRHSNTDRASFWDRGHSRYQGRQKDVYTSGRTSLLSLPRPRCSNRPSMTTTSPGAQSMVAS